MRRDKTLQNINLNYNTLGNMLGPKDSQIPSHLWRVSIWQYRVTNEKQVKGWERG